MKATTTNSPLGSSYGWRASDTPPANDNLNAVEDSYNDDTEGWDDACDFEIDDVDVDNNVDTNNNNDNNNNDNGDGQDEAYHERRLALYLELCRYLESLDQIKNSLNTLLQAEYNTLEKATELVAYYSERPQLLDYTLQKELPRLEYSLCINEDTDTHVTDKYVIAEYLRSHSQHDASFLLARCANQSILADLLHVLTGPDALVRPQYLTAAVAQSCSLVIHREYLTVHAVLQLSLPTTVNNNNNNNNNNSNQGQRWNFATLTTSILFQPDPVAPRVEYRLESLQTQPVEPNEGDDDLHWAQHLERAADFLASLAPELEYHEAPPPVLNVRDAFLQQSSQLLQTLSAANVQTAWNNLPGLLPPDHVLDAVEQAHAESPASNRRPHQRPSSILGGWLNKIAKSVTLPNEDPSLYQPWNQPQQHGPSPISSAAVPTLYRKPDEPRSILTRPFHIPSATPRAPPPPPPPRQQYSAQTEVTVPSAIAMTTPEDWRDADLGEDSFNQWDHEEEIIFDDVDHDTSVASIAAAPSRFDEKEKVVDSEKISTIGWEDSAADEFMDAAETASDKNASDSALLFRGNQQIELESSLFQKESHFPQQQQQQQWAPETDKSFISKLPPLLPDTNSSPDFVYDPETDIVPSRKRWVNPCPGSRVLGQLTT